MAKKLRNVSGSGEREVETSKVTLEDDDGRKEVEVLLRVALEGVIRAFAEGVSLDGKGVAPSISDLLRIVQLLRDLTVQEPIKGIEVKWVDNSEAEYST